MVTWAVENTTPFRKVDHMKQMVFNVLGRPVVETKLVPCLNLEGVSDGRRSMPSQSLNSGSGLIYTQKTEPHKYKLLLLRNFRLLVDSEMLNLVRSILGDQPDCARQRASLLPSS